MGPGITLGMHGAIKTVHHFDRDQEGKKGNKNFSGKLPNTATSLRSSFRGDPGNVTTGTDSGGSSGGGASTRTSDSTS